MTGSAAAAAISAVTDNNTDTVRLDHVLAGVELTGPAGRLAGMLEAGFLTEAGWDPVARVLSLPAEHPLLGRTLCRVGGCPATAHGAKTGGVCWRCFTRLTGQGLAVVQIACSAELPVLPVGPAGCAVVGCQRMSPSPRSLLCEPHRRRYRRKPGASLEEFLTDPRVLALPPLGPCNVTACTRRAESEHGYCPTHYVRWRNTITANPPTDEQHWQLTQSAVSVGGQVSLRGLSPLVVVEVLFGVQQRVRGATKITDVDPAGGLRHAAPSAGAGDRCLSGPAGAR